MVKSYNPTKEKDKELINQLNFLTTRIIDIPTDTKNLILKDIKKILNKYKNEYISLSNEKLLLNIIKNELNCNILFKPFEKVPFIIDFQNDELNIIINEKIYNNLDKEGKEKFLLKILVSLLIIVLPFLAMVNENFIFYFDLDFFLDRTIFKELDFIAKELKKDF